MEGKLTLSTSRSRWGDDEGLAPSKTSRIHPQYMAWPRGSVLGPGDPEKDLKRIDGLINSMTQWERENPTKIDRSRRNRIASGAGVEPAEVNGLVKQFSEMSTLMKRMSGMGKLE